VQIRVETGSPWDVRADVLAVPIVGDPEFRGPLDELDRRSGGELRALAAFGELRSKRYHGSLAAAGQLPVSRLLAVGGGDPATLDREVARRISASVVRRLAGRTAAGLAIWLAPLAAVLGGDEAAAEIVARGIVEGAYDPRSLYPDAAADPPPKIETLVLIAAEGASATRVEQAATRGQVIGEGSNLARSLANRAANEISPEGLAEEAWSIAERHGLWIDVVGPDRAAELGMGMFLAVGKGSDNPPRMIVMRSGKAAEKDGRGRHLALIGKGVCFDSGGISIKPSAHMDEMKLDKTGACTVIAAMATVARLAPGTPVLALAPAVENMPGPHSTRPGDVVRAMNGTWVEITNTDAEGRLILGDAMTYAEQLGATHLVDVATLTGAVSRALGQQVTGAFGTPQAWCDEVAAASRRAGERTWQLPMIDDYRTEMETAYTRLDNAGGAEGSLVKSAMFLREFATKPWVHLDIAGTAYYRKAEPYLARGATGVSLATLVELALDGARPAAG
jgi:leucyl aminopeptidase